MFRNKNVLLLGSVVLIVLAIGLVSILNRTSTSGSSTDVRARAAVGKTLEVNATVAAIDQAEGTMTVDNLYFADVSRSGEAKNLGTWTVTVPATVNLASFAPSMNVLIGIDSTTFLATNHTVKAISVVRANK